MKTSRYSTLEEQIGVIFKNQKLLDMAFVHKSYVNEHQGEMADHNERLEFLGDAVLELVVTEHLYKKFPNHREGDLTSFRAALVKGKHLAEVASALNLVAYLYLSHGEERSGGRKKQYILANTIEALIGVIYLDRGFSTSHEFVEKFILTHLGDILMRKLHVDAKSQFQEIAQEKLGITPMYALISEEGPDHDKIFTMGAFLEKDLIGKGQGSSKQKAEQEAAFDALNAKGWIDMEATKKKK